MNMQKKFIIKLNNFDKVEALLQETYDLVTTQINQTQNEINKITNSTQLNDADIEVKEKYAKIVNGYLTTIQKAIDKKFDIAKFMGEVAKHNGDLSKALEEDSVVKSGSLDLAKIRQMAKEIQGADNLPQQYEVKKTDR